MSQASEKLRALNEEIEEKKKFISEIDKRQKENDELLVVKKKELEHTDRLLEEAKKTSLLEVEKRNTMFDVSTSLTGNNLQSPADGQKVLNFNSIKWEEKPFTGMRGVRLTDQDYASVISTNAVSVDDVICFGLRWQYSDRYSTCEFFYSVAFLQVKNIEITKLNLQPTLTDFTLTTCKRAFHIVGGEFVNQRSSTRRESNLILSCVGQTKMESNYPPMKTASASPAVVTYKERIVVVHGRGAKGEIEILDTNSVNPVWVQLQVHFPSWETPSAIVVGSTLVVWVGGLYCMSLEYVTASPQHQLPPGIYPIAAPPIIETGYPPKALNWRLLTLRGQLVAIGRPQVEGCGMHIHAYRSATREWVNIDNRKQFHLALATSATSLTVLQLTSAHPSSCSCIGYIGSV